MASVNKRPHPIPIEKDENQSPMKFPLKEDKKSYLKKTVSNKLFRKVFETKLISTEIFSYLSFEDLKNLGESNKIIGKIICDWVMNFGDDLRLGNFERLGLPNESIGRMILNANGVNPGIHEHYSFENVEAFVIVQVLGALFSMKHDNIVDYWGEFAMYSHNEHGIAAILLKLSSETQLKYLASIIEAEDRGMTKSFDPPSILAYIFIIAGSNNLPMNPIFVMLEKLLRNLQITAVKKKAIIQKFWSQMTDHLGDLYVVPNHLMEYNVEIQARKKSIILTTGKFGRWMMKIVYVDGDPNLSKEKEILEE